MDATRSTASDLGDSMDSAMAQAAEGADGATEAVGDLGDETTDAGGKGTEAGAAFGAAFKGIAAGAAIAAAAVAGIAIAAVSLSDEANVIAKQAAVVGETAEDFQVLQGVFDLMTDGSVNAQMALVKLNKGLDDAASGIGPAAEALERLGLSADELIQMSAIDRIATIGDAVGTLDNRAAQTLVSMDLLGRAGFALVPAMAAGGEAIRDAADDFRGAGVISNELAADSEVLQDEILLLGQSLSSLANEGLEPVIPLLSDMAAGVREVIGAVKEDGAIDEFTESMNRLGQTVFIVEEEFDLWDEIITAAIHNLSRMVDTVALLLEVGGLLPKALDSWITGSDRLDQALVRVDANLTALLGKLHLLSGESQAAGKNLEIEGNKAGDAAVKNAELRNELKLLTEANEDLRDELEKPVKPAAGAALTELVDLAAVRDTGDALTTAAEEIAAQTEGIWELYYDAINAMEMEAYQLRLDHARDLANVTLQSTSDAFGGISALADATSVMLSQSGDELTEEQKKRALDAWVIGQQTAAAQATISGALAIAAAATTPFPGTIPAVIGATALAAGTVIKIQSAQPPKLHTGGLLDNEIPFIGQEGESVNNRLGTRTIGEEGLRRINRGEGMPSGLTVINKVNNRTTNVASHEAIRTRSGELYDETVRTVQPKSGTRVPTWARG
jgi:hypothetical protein